MRLISCVLALVFSGVALSEASAQFANQPGQKWSMLSLLQHEQIREELGFTDEQSEKFKLYYVSANEEWLAALENLFDSGHSEEAKERLARTISNIEGSVREFVLPAQMERLQQIGAQFRYQLNKNSMGIMAKDVVKYLELDKKQEHEISKMSSEYEKELAELVAEMQEKIAEKKRSHRENLLEVLSPEQKEKYEKVFGPIYLPKPTERRRVRDKES